MKEKNIEVIIRGLTEQYGYLLDDIRSKVSKTELWTVRKEIGGVQYRLIFVTEDRINELSHYDISEDESNIFILFSESDLNTVSDAKGVFKSEVFSMNNLLDKPLIRVDIKERQINYSENVNLEVVKNLADIISNSNLPSNGERTGLKDKSIITMGIIAINIIMYILTAYLSYVYGNGSIFDSDTRVLVLLGAKVNTLIAKGQYFRLISCMFLHGGIVHLGVNMYSLYAIGPMVEKIYGKAKYISIYLVAGICSSIFSYSFSTNVSIGASGAIFGLLGAVLVFAIKSKGRTGSAFLKNILSVIFVNIFIGMTLPNIDNFGHIGGLLGGIIISYLLTLRAKD